MKTETLKGKKITGIFEVYRPEVYGLDTNEIFIVLDDGSVIDIPAHFSEEVWQKELPAHAERILPDAAFLNQPVSGFISYPGEPTDKGFIVLENGTVLTEQLVAPHGTALAGLHIFSSVDKLAARYGNDFVRTV